MTNGFTINARVAVTNETARRIRYIFLKNDAFPVVLADSNLPIRRLSNTLATELASLIKETDRMKEAVTEDDTERRN